MPKCSNCHRPLDEGLNFCPYCGEKMSQKIDKLCPSCNQIYNDNDINFCGKCGARLIIREIEQLTNGKHTINSLDNLVEALNNIVHKIDAKANCISKDELMLFRDINNRERYNIFYIRKKRKGRYRMISSPVPRLKIILRGLNELLYQYFSPASYVTGFVRNASIIDNGRIHVGQRYIYTIDLDNFFESVKVDVIVSYLCKPPYNFSIDVANTIAYISCVKNIKNNTICLSQGSPLSPILSNIVCVDLDKKLNGLASFYRAQYSRYADDITFSSYNNIYSRTDEFARKVKIIIEESNFKINYNKIHISGPQSRHYITGIVANAKVNVPREYTDSIRNLLYIWKQYGVNDAYERFDEWYKKRNKGKSTPFIGDFLRGQIEYTGTVRGKNDLLYKRFKNDLDILIKDGFRPFCIKLANKKVASIVQSEPVVKYGKKYYTAILRWSGEKVLISPKLNAYIESGVDKYPLQELKKYCVLYKIFDFDGVKIVMTTKK